jgi:isochorismate pyruvate lyase
MKTPASLHDLRLKIDTLDAELVKLLHARHTLVEQVVVVKRENILPGRIPSRVDEVINNAAQRAQAMGCDPDLARTVWTAMVEWFVRHEEVILDKDRWHSVDQQKQSRSRHTPSSAPATAHRP